MTHRITFPGTGRTPVDLPEGAELSEALHAANSTLLFGCRTGICGTCVVRATVLSGTLPPPDDHEAEILSLYAPDDPEARLACQLSACCDLALEAIDP